MKVKLYGTRGSLPVAGTQYAKYGGNTTSIQVESTCLPPGLVLAIDAGSGFLPLSQDGLKSGMTKLVLLMTHHHHDHTQGALIAPPFFMPQIAIDVYGPVESGVGPREVFETTMKPPYHPVDFKTVAHHIRCHDIEHPTTKVFVCHPRGGFKMIEIELYNRCVASKRHLPFGGGESYPLDECLVITMHRTEHPERTIGYRFAEPSGKTFVFLTDEEVRAAVPSSLKAFLKGADLLIGDAQYCEDTYRTRTAGFGHGTPAYVVGLALEAGAKKVGLTHHDPKSSDDVIDSLVAEGRALVGEKSLEVFGCADGAIIEL